MSIYKYQPRFDYPLDRHPGKWTTQRNIRLISYARDGRPVEYIAKELGFTPEKILKRIRYFAIDYQPKKTPNVTTKICTHKVRAKTRKNAPPTRTLPATHKKTCVPVWSKSDDKKIIYMARAGRTAEQIAQALGGVDANQVSIRKIALSMTGRF